MKTPPIAQPELELLGVGSAVPEPNPCVRLFGPGPAGARCQSCRFLFGNTPGNRTFWKCRQRVFTRSDKSDHRVRWRACSRYEKRPTA